MSGLSPKEHEIVKAGMGAAAFATCSPHEWKWSEKEQLAMARTCCLLNRELSAALRALRKAKRK